ncbi:MAG: hypothetical protein FWD23_03370 [Oscillospiraceae bacterium]|nr:hypothetical protein [Oscillospiraceae bacterium]
MPDYKKQKETVLDLAKQIAETAAMPIQQKTLNEWKALNSLKSARPMFIIDQFYWDELLCDELKCECEDGFLRGFEWNFRTLLYRWKHMQDDRVIFPEVRIGKHIDVISPQGMDFKLKEIEGTRAKVTGEDLLQTEDDIENIRYLELAVDEKKSGEYFEKTKELFDGVLTVRQSGFTGYSAPWDNISLWHGVNNSIADIADRPEFVRKVLERTFDVWLKAVDEYERHGLIGVGEPYIHYSGTFTDELPGFAGESEQELEKFRYSAKNTWTMGMAQIFSMVSPETHLEFEIEYQKKYYSRFGLGYYGCCEPLDKKIHIIRRLPGVRKISMSPWADMEAGSEAMAGDYVFSRKPNPMFLANDSAWDAEAVRKDLEQACKTAQRYNNPCELILKDITTVGKKPERLWEWAKIAAGVCGRGG